MPNTISIFFTVMACALLIDGAALPLECFNPESSSSAEGCLEMMRMSKRHVAAAPEKKGYDYIRFGKRSSDSGSHSAESFENYQLVERPRMPMATRNFVFKPFLI